MWAKIVNDEVMQLHEEDPTGLWHPDAIEKNDIPGHWELIPDDVHIGWKLKNEQWISGGQWLDEFMEENPIPPPGPPTANWDQTEIASDVNTLTVRFNPNPVGYYDSFSWNIDGKEYSDKSPEITFTRAKTTRNIPVEFIVTGPGGTVTNDSLFVELKAKIIPV